MIYFLIGSMKFKISHENIDKEPYRDHNIRPLQNTVTIYLIKGFFNKVYLYEKAYLYVMIFYISN